MPRVSNFEIFKQTACNTLSIRESIVAKNMPAFVGKSYAKIDNYLRDIKEYKTYFPFIAYHNMDINNLDVELAFPVSRLIKGSVDIKNSIIAENIVVSCMYIGVYKDISLVYSDMTKWININGLKPMQTYYEYYYNDLSFGEKNLITKIIIPVIK